MDTFDIAVKSVSDVGNSDLMTHFIYCLYHLRPYKNLKSLFMKNMRKYEIQSAVLTVLLMDRLDLITKEKQIQLYEGKLKNDEDWTPIIGVVMKDPSLMIWNHFLTESKIKK